MKKSLAEHGDKLDAGEKEKIEAALKDAEEALKGEDKAAIEAKTEALMTASQKLGEKMYADAQAAQAAAGAGAGGGAEAPRRAAKPADDNVVDAEFKEVKKVIRRTGRCGLPCYLAAFDVTGLRLHAQRGGFVSDALRSFHGKARLLRSPRRAEERHRGRHQEGLSQAGHEAPP